MSENGEIHTAAKKNYTAAGSDGSDKFTSASELYLLVVIHIKCVAVNWGLATGN